MPYVSAKDRLDHEAVTSLSKIKAILFDAGGTLIKTNPAVADTFQKLAQSHGYYLSYAEIYTHLEEMDDLYEVLYDEDDSFWCTIDASRSLWIRLYTFLARRMGIVGRDGRLLAEQMYEFYISPSGWEAYPEIKQTLAVLSKNGLRLGVISNWGSGLHEILCALGLDSYFEVIVSSAAVGLKKPDQEIFTYTAHQLGISNCEALFIGDHRYADVYGSLRAGMIPVHLLRSKREVGAGVPTPLENTDAHVFTAESCADLMALLKISE